MIQYMLKGKIANNLKSPSVTGRTTIMWYPNGGPYRRRIRRGGFPFLIPLLIFFFIFSHQWELLLPLLLLGGFIFLLVNAINASSPSNNTNQQTPYYQPSNQSQKYYQPSNQTPYYQPSSQQSYQPYDQGYQAQQPSQNTQQSSAYYQPGAAASSAATSSYDYEEYEQPQAQYPEQEPPMIQQ